MYGLSVLAEIVKSRKPPATVTLKRSLSGVLPDVPCEVFAAGEAQPTRWKVGAVEPLTLLLLAWSLSIASSAIIIRLFLVVVVVAHFHILIFIPF